MADVKTSYLVPISIMTPLMAELQRNNIKDQLIERAIAHGIAPNSDQLVVRAGRPIMDFAVAGPGGTITGQWITGALVAVTPATYVNNALAVTKVCAFYKVAQQSAAPVISEFSLMVGAAATTRGTYYLEDLYAEQAAVGYLSEPIFFEPNETIFIQVYPRAAAAGGERLAFGTLICEPKGPVVSQ